MPDTEIDARNEERALGKGEVLHHTGYPEQGSNLQENLEALTSQNSNPRSKCRSWL
jgi:hypothetical protein